ncbi:glutaredoxin domain-containing protein [Sanguibacter massiliensis]|uniref:glutaredoxin domain-containing protein n=1 Tax=Sanguibacter massiliensis TaxID=1973217 RepID=UPI000C86154C
MSGYKITEFAKPNCGPCAMTASRMDKLGMEYTQINLPADPPALERVKALGYFQAPVVLVEDAEGNVVDHWSGFRPNKIDATAKLVGAAPARTATGPTTHVEAAPAAQMPGPDAPRL